MAATTQVKFSTTVTYDFLLKAIAKSYDLSVSTYCARIMERIIREEVVNLGIPVERSIPSSWLDIVRKQITEEYFIPRPSQSVFVRETEENFSKYQAYLFERLGVGGIDTTEVKSNDIKASVSSVQSKSYTKTSYPPLTTTSDVKSFEEEARKAKVTTREAGEEVLGKPAPSIMTQHDSHYNPTAMSKPTSSSLSEVDNDDDVEDL